MNDKKENKKLIQGNIYAYVNERGFVNLVLNIESIGELEVCLKDYNNEKQRQTNKKLAYKIYMTGK